MAEGAVQLEWEETLRLSHPTVNPASFSNDQHGGRARGSSGGMHFMRVSNHLLIGDSLLRGRKHACASTGQVHVETQRLSRVQPNAWSAEPETGPGYQALPTRLGEHGTDETDKSRGPGRTEA